MFSKISIIFVVHARTYPPRGISLQRINRHGTYIQGYLLTWSRSENCSGLKRIHGFWEIFVFGTKSSRFLTSLFESNCPCACITLELRKALRVMYYDSSWGRSPFQSWAPGRATKIQVKLRRRQFSINFDHFRGACPNLSSSTTFSKTHKQTRRLHSWIARDLIYIRKLLRGQTNSRILRNLHFSHQKFKIFD